MNWLQRTWKYVVNFTPLLLLLGGLFFLFFYLRSTSVVIPDNPNAPLPTIIGNDKPFPLGELVTVEIMPFKSPPPDLVKVGYEWRIFDGEKEKTNTQVNESGSRISFGAGIVEKKYFAICSVTYLFHTKTEKENFASSKTYLLTFWVVVGQNPNPPPPPPPDDPVFPAGRFELSKFSYDKVKTDVKADKVKGAKILSDSFKSTASAIAAGVLREPEMILKEAKKANVASLEAGGVPIASWDKWFDSLQERLYSLYTTNKLNVASDYKDAFLEISEGLSKVK